MNEFALYLLKSACWLTGFTLIYLLFLRNEHFFVLKRIFLVTGIMASILCPFISFHYQVEVPVSIALPFDQAQELVPVSTFIQQTQISESKIDFRIILLLVYILGIVIFVTRMIYHILQIFKSIDNQKINRTDSFTIIRSSEFPSSFAFFNYIFINPSVEEKELREIMNHELVHVKQKHWLDLLLVECLRMLQWANPIAWIYTGFIRLNHEFLADKEALMRSSDPLLYKATLLNQIFRSPVISLSNSFNYSIHKNRFEMMKNIITSPYRKLKVLFIFPVFAILFYAFAEPELKEPVQRINTEGLTNPSVDKGVKGIVQNEDGKPFQGVQIAVTQSYIRETTDASGSFTLAAVPEGSHLLFSYRGYITQVLKPKFSGSMTIKLLKDPTYTATRVSPSMQNMLVVINGVISEKSYSDAINEYDINKIAKVLILKDKQAVDKYGDKGKNGVVELITKDKAAEFGIKVPFHRQNPEDFPTFRGDSHLKFSNWLVTRIRYPSDAVNKGIKGRVSVNYVVEPNGTITNVKVMSSPDPSLSDAVVKAVNESPIWEPAKNPESKDPFSTSVTLKFELPDKITIDNTYVVVEQMPEYPGGDIALLEFIKSNQRYPETARAEKVEGRVIIRFVINSLGKVEDAVVLKGVNSELDAEALRVVSLLSGWLPGAQGGKPVDTWYMVPVTFSLSTPETTK